MGVRFSHESPNLVGSKRDCYSLLSFIESEVVIRKAECPVFSRKIHKRESEPLDRTVTIKRSKHSDRVCNSSRGDVEVVAYTKL